MRCRANRDFFLLFFFFDFVGSKEWIWKYDSDITNPENWVGGKVAEGCKGVHFAPINSAPVVVQELTTGEVTLPADGEIGIVDGGFILFKDNRKCIKLKPIDYHEWYDPDSWIQTDNNVAIPDKQKIPCTYDDVTIPKPNHSRISNSIGLIKVRSLKLEKQPIDSNRFYAKATDNNMFLNSELPSVYLSPRSSCKDPYGCLCHDFSIPCSTQDQEKLKCKDPVTPEEFCRDICGAYLTYSPDKGPDLVKLKKKLEEYPVSTYVSRAMDYLGKEVIQVVFSEKEYTGSSMEDAESFHQYLQSFQVTQLQIFQSGEFYLEGGTNPLSITFGSLAAVLVFFGILFYLNRENPTVNTFVTRLNLHQIVDRFNRSRGSVFVPFFARFDTTDENLIIDGQSETGSIVDISKSFDNPMYGQATSQAITTTEHENPLYEVAKDVDVEE